MEPLLNIAVTIVVAGVLVTSLIACGTLAWLGIVVFNETRGRGVIQSISGALTMAVLVVSGVGLACLIAFLFANNLVIG